MRKALIVILICCAVPVAAQANDVKVFSATNCQPTASSSNYLYELGAILNTNTNFSRLTVFCPVTRDSTGEPGWDTIEIFVRDASTSQNFDCRAEILHADGHTTRGNANETQDYSSSTGVQTLSFSTPSDNGDVGSWAVYGFNCTMPDSTDTNRSAIFGYKIEE